MCSFQKCASILIQSVTLIILVFWFLQNKNAATHHSTSIVRVIERSKLIGNARHIFSYGSGRRHTQNAARHEDVHARHDGRNRNTQLLQDHGCPTSPLVRGVKHTLTYNIAAGAPRIKVMSGSFGRQRVSTSSRWPGMPTLRFVFTWHADEASQIT